MQCPVCPHSQLTMTNREGIEIDYCPQCRGIWLDRGELDKIIERTAPVASSTVAGQAAPAAWGSAPPPNGARQDPYYKPRHRDYDDDDHRRHRGYDDDYKYRKKKRGGFLGELFDFD